MSKVGMTLFSRHFPFDLRPAPPPNFPSTSVTPPGHPKAALPVALEANEMTDHKIPSYLDTLSLAYHLTGDTAKAIENQKKAISLLPADADRGEYEAALARFEAALPTEQDAVASDPPAKQDE